MAARRGSLTAVVLANGAPHQALPRTATLCPVAAPRIEGSPVHDAALPTDAALRVAMPSGILTADPSGLRGGDRHAERGAVIRRAWPPVRGAVYVDARPPSA